jgi:outer membrane protein OmpA-like peptidoglycan-associated protein
VAVQLKAEQDEARRLRGRVRELGRVNERLQASLRVAELEARRASEKLAVTERALPFPPIAGPAPAEALAGTVTFAPGSKSLTGADRERIARVARELASKGYVEIYVDGHSDPTPIDRTQGAVRSNMELSAVRALAVYHALVGEPGVRPDRVSVRAFGEHRPGTAPPGGLRRVEIRYRPAPPSAPKESRGTSREPPAEAP